MRILIISACSSQKQFDADIDCETLDSASRQETLQYDSDHVRPAREMYTGREHTRVTEAVDQLDTIEGIDVDWAIISAGYGVVDAETEIAPYDCTFSKHANTKSDFQERADRLGIHNLDRTTDELIEAIGDAKDIPSDLRQYDFNRYDLIFAVLGEEYLLTASDAFASCPIDTAGYAFTPESTCDLTGEFTPIPASEEERRELDEAFLTLKGTQLRTLTGYIETPKDAKTLQDNPQRVHSLSVTPTQ